MKKYLLAAMLMAYAIPNALAQGENQIGADLGVEGGGIAIGADFVHSMAKNWGVGGFFQFFDKKDASASSTAFPGLVTFGAQVNVHYVIDRFDVYVNPGLGLEFRNSTNGANNQTSFGPRLAIGAMYRINDQWEAGLENIRYWSWLNSAMNGELVDDLSLRGRYTF